VEWPAVPTDEVLARLRRYREEVRRVCLSMVTHRQAYADTLVLVRRLATEAGGPPLSVLVAPPVVNEARLQELQAAGVERMGIGLDAASERLFQRRRPGLSWLHYWQTIEAAREVFGPDRVNCHLVVGLGETDAELIETCFRLRAMQVSPYLFSFYPEPGSPMARTRRPSLVRWRRLQLVTCLLERYDLPPEQIGFDDRGRLARLEVAPAQLRSALADGQPFLTHGCPDADGGLACTRPFGSYRPGEPFRDYPLAPEPEDLQQIERQLRLEAWAL
jgi:biotin synthase